MNDPLHFDEAVKEEKPWALPNTPSQAAPQERSAIPPPPSDIVIRTMESDIVSLGFTGGNRPQGRKISIVPAADGGSSAGAGKVLKTVTFAAVAVAVMALILYFLFSSFFSSEDPATTPDTGNSGTSFPIATSSTGGQQPSPNVPAGNPPVLSTPVPVGPFEHQSFLRKPVDETLSMTLGEKPQNASQILTFPQRLARTLSTAKASSASIELKTQSPTGAALSIGEFFYHVNAALMDQRFLAENFNPDFTAFLIKDKGGFWPSYVLQLKPEKNWLFVTPEISRLESSTSLEVLFAVDPGSRVSGGFKEETLAGQQARILSYSNPNAQFIYGWLRNYFIISTSRAAFDATVQRL